MLAMIFMLFCLTIICKIIFSLMAHLKESFLNYFLYICNINMLFFILTIVNFLKAFCDQVGTKNEFLKSNLILIQYEKRHICEYIIIMVRFVI